LYLSMSPVLMQTHNMQAISYFQTKEVLVHSAMHISAEKDLD